MRLILLAYNLVMSIISLLLLCVASHSLVVQSFSVVLNEPKVPDVLNISPPAKIPPSVAIDLATDGVAVVDNYACPDTINLLRFDALRLQYLGQDRSAGVSQNNNPSGGRELRKCSQFWLQDVESESGGYLGPDYISELISTIEDEVDGTSPLSRNKQETAAAAAVAAESDVIDQIIHRQETEAAYLYYNEGGYYDWHFDTPSHTKASAAADPTVGTHRRAFSFLLYLGGHENDAEPWNVEEDGGELRVYPRISLEDQHRRINGNVEGHIGVGWTDYTDITPQEGTLVIFKSEAICHQVMTTNRKRLVVVGWIHGDLD